jgi:hypothetical protein
MGVSGIVEPATGWSMLAPYREANAVTMQKFLDAAAKKLGPREHAVMVLDRAGWHIAKGGNKSVQRLGRLNRPGASIAPEAGQPPDDRIEVSTDNHHTRAADDCERPDKNELERDRAGRHTVELDRGIWIEKHREPANRAGRPDRDKKPPDRSEHQLKVPHANSPVDQGYRREDMARKPDRLGDGRRRLSPLKVS